ncbi:AKT-interacting protein-like isoform X3 [Gigantopelta aegis]|uniref:AKT-interacting protein-like isoform X3 n=1 Tax=Gigantopelta aegis TaxID=1735272 RepID=UPI001B8883A9|nr:AKT-interacting protein-like isoform X3 [Gigantopelta aegis]
MDSQIQDSPSSGRKQLPSIPSDPRMNHSQLKSPANLGANGYGTYFQEYSLMAEYNQLHRQKMPGVYVIPSAHCSHIWNGVLFIRQGLYQEGVFRFTLTIPDNYPDSECPSLVFEYPIFHPVVHPKTGEVDVKRAFPRWRRNNNHLWQVLLYARRIFYKIEIKDPLNEEAADLYLQDLEKFKKKVSESVKSAKTQALEPPKSDDPFAIRFNEMDPALFEQAKQDMLNSKANDSKTKNQQKSVFDKSTQKTPAEDQRSNPSSLGLSWMLPGSAEIFSAEDASMS